MQYSELLAASRSALQRNLPYPRIWDGLAIREYYSSNPPARKLLMFYEFIRGRK